MSASDICGLDLSGQPWSVWEEVINKLDEYGTCESLAPSKAFEANSDAMLLPRDDFWLFGNCPERDGLNLVLCNKCGFALKHLALAHHLEVRHSEDDKKSIGITLDSVRKEEAKILITKSSNSHSKSKPKPPNNLVPKTTIPTLNVSLPLPPALASLVQPEKVKEKIRETPLLPPPSVIPILKISTSSKPQSHSKGESHSKSSTHSKSSSHSKSNSHSKTSSSSKSSQSGSSSNSSKSTSVPSVSKDAVLHSSSKTILSNKSSSASKSSSSSSLSKTSPSSKSSPSNKSPSQSKSSSSKSSSYSKTPSPGKSLLSIKSSSSGKSSSSSKTTPSSKTSSSSTSSKTQSSSSAKSTVPSKSSSSSSKSSSGSKSLLISKSNPSSKSSIPTKNSSSSKEQVSLLVSPATPMSTSDSRTDSALSAKIHSISLSQTNTGHGKKKPRSDRKMLPIKDREYDADTHCGVRGADDTKPCTRSLTCKSHTLSLRRAVQGRSKNFDTLLSDHRAVKEAASKASKAASMPSNNISIPATSASIVFQATSLHSIPATSVSKPVLEAIIAQTTPKVANTITQSGGSYIAVTLPSQSLSNSTPQHNSVLIPRTPTTKHVSSSSARSVVHQASRPSASASQSAGISRPQQSFSVNQGKFQKTAQKQTSLLNRSVNPASTSTPVAGPGSVVVAKSSATPDILHLASPIESRSPTYHNIILPQVRPEEKIRTPNHYAQPIKSDIECQPLELTEDLLLSMRSDSDVEDLDEIERNLSPLILDLEETDVPSLVYQSNGLPKVQVTFPTYPRETPIGLAPNRKVPLSRQDTTEFTAVLPTKSPSPLKSTDSLLISNHATSTIKTVITNMARQGREVGEKFAIPAPPAKEPGAKVPKVTFSNNWKPVPPQEVASPITLCNLSSVLSIPTTRPTPAQVHSVVARQQAQPIKILPIPSVSQKTSVKDLLPKVAKVVKRLNDGPKLGGKKGKKKKMPDVNPAAIISTLLAKKQRQGAQIPCPFKWETPTPKLQTDNRCLETIMALELQKDRPPGPSLTQQAPTAAGAGGGNKGPGTIPVKPPVQGPITATMEIRCTIQACLEMGERYGLILENPGYTVQPYLVAALSNFWMPEEHLYIKARIRTRPNL